MYRHVNRIALLGITALLCLFVGCGTLSDKAIHSEEKYPTKPITLIVPFSAGGGSDLTARAMEKLAIKYLGQPIVVVNKLGGGGTIGWNEIAGANPDGYTLCIANVGVILQPLYSATRYHYLTALEPIAQIVSVPIVVAVKADQPWDNINQLLQYAKANPGEIKFGHAGLGTEYHVAGEMLARNAGIQMEQVPFQGGSEALASLLGGHIQLLFTAPAAVKEHVKAGRVKVLGVVSEKRCNDPLFIGVPTLKEQGVNVVFSAWNGLVAPKGLSSEVKAKLEEGFRGIITDPEFVTRMQEMGMEPDYLAPRDALNKLIDENERLGKIIKETGIAEKIAAQKK